MAWNKVRNQRLTYESKPVMLPMMFRSNLITDQNFRFYRPHMHGGLSELDTESSVDRKKSALAQCVRTHESKTER